MSMTLSDDEQAVRDIALKLKQFGIASATVEYSGSGDSGGVDSVTFFDKDGNEVGAAAGFIAGGSLDGLDDELGELVCELVHADFNNDGSGGEATLDTETMILTVDHTTYYTESDTHKHEFDLTQEG